MKGMNDMKIKIKEKLPENKLKFYLLHKSQFSKYNKIIQNELILNNKKTFELLSLPLGSPMPSREQLLELARREIEKLGINEGSWQIFQRGFREEKQIADYGEIRFVESPLEEHSNDYLLQGSIEPAPDSKDEYFMLVY
jgi:hypothetical protein